MAYQIFWQVPEQVLCIQLSGSLSLDDFDRINQNVINYLGDEINNRGIVLLVDITQPSSMPQAFERLKASQTYLTRRDLKFILVAGSNKLMRLMMMLIFNLCRPSLKFFDTLDQALTIAQKATRTT